MCLCHRPRTWLDIVSRPVPAETAGGEKRIRPKLATRKSRPGQDTNKRLLRIGSNKVHINVHQRAAGWAHHAPKDKRKGKSVELLEPVNHRNIKTGGKTKEQQLRRHHKIRGRLLVNQLLWWASHAALSRRPLSQWPLQHPRWRRTGQQTDGQKSQWLPAIIDLFMI